MAPLGRILEVLLPAQPAHLPGDFRLADRAGGRFPASLAPRRLLDLGPADRDRLLRIWQAGDMRVRVSPAREARERQVSLACDPPWPVRPLRTQRIELLDHLLAEGPQNLEALGKTLGPDAPRLAQALAVAGLVRISYASEDEDAAL
jgi:primosomal protein N' (replication factor Y)